jgi:hypothetical protein
MSRNEIIFTAVMSAIIAHLIVAIVFMSLKISALKTSMQSEVSITLEEQYDEPPVEEKKLSEMTEGELIQNATAEQLVNIAKNISDKPIDIDPAEYQDLVKNELIQSGKLGTSNYIDEQKNAESTSNDEIPVDNKEQKPVEIQQKKEKVVNSTFRGPTRIFYDLTNPSRYHTYLPIPIYKCEGAGQVTLIIEVDQDGTVLKATPASQLSSTSDECLTETAVTYALRSKFNINKNAPPIQKGFLTFVFVSQKK